MSSSASTASGGRADYFSSTKPKRRHEDGRERPTALPSPFRPAFDQIQPVLRSSPGVFPGEGDRPQDGGGLLPAASPLHQAARGPPPLQGGLRSRPELIAACSRSAFCVRWPRRSEAHTSELKVTNAHIVCRFMLEKH